MDEVKRQDITINGAGTVGGGQYGDVTINGSGTLNGDIDCQSLTIHGAGTMNGALSAGTVSIHGAGTVQGDAVLTELAVHGAATFHGSITAEAVEIHGALTAKEDCTTERFTAEGGFTIGGLLNADTIEIALHGNCRAREIGGSTIRVALAKNGFSSLNKLFHALINHRYGLTAETIEGDDIYLEQTTAKIVRGKRIVLGPGCEIEQLEYTESLEVADDARVMEQAKVGSAFQGRTANVGTDSPVVEDTGWDDDELLDEVLSSMTGSDLQPTFVLKLKPDAKNKTRYGPNFVRELMKAVDGQRNVAEVIKFSRLNPLQAREIIKGLISHSIIEACEPELTQPEA